MSPTRELVIAKVESMFPAEWRDIVLAELDRYPGDSAEGRARVQLAVLKGANGDVEKVAEWIDVALRDFRDVIAPTEYPRQTALGFVGTDALSAAEREEVIRRDREQWLEWLAS